MPWRIHGLHLHDRRGRAGVQRAGQVRGLLPRARRGRPRLPGRRLHYRHHEARGQGARQRGQNHRLPRRLHRAERGQQGLRADNRYPHHGRHGQRELLGHHVPERGDGHQDLHPPPRHPRGSRPRVHDEALRGDNRLHRHGRPGSGRGMPGQHPRHAQLDGRRPRARRSPMP